MTVEYRVITESLTGRRRILYRSHSRTACEAAARIWRLDYPGRRVWVTRAGE